MQVLPTLPTEIIVEIAKCHHSAFNGLKHANKALYAELARVNKLALFCDRIVDDGTSAGTVDYKLKTNGRTVLNYTLLKIVKVVHIYVWGDFYMSKSYSDYTNLVNIWIYEEPISTSRICPATNTFEEEVLRIITTA